MSKKAQQYSLGADVEDNSVNDNLRRAARAINVEDPLTDEWLTVSLDLETLCNQSNIEASEEESKTEQMLGKSTQETLWDSRRSVETLKIIVEEAKINVILRLLKDLKFFQQFEGFNMVVQDCMTRHNRTREDILAKIDNFEFNAGILLKRILDHIEAMQLCDLPMLFEYIGEVCNSMLQTRLINPENLDIRQESLIFHYLLAVYKNIDSLQEDQIIHWTKENRVFSLMIDILQNFNASYPNHVKMVLLEALGAFCDSETFKTKREEFYKDEEQKNGLIAARNSYIRELIVAHPDRRKFVRPFLDAIDRIERDIKLAKYRK